MWDLGLSSVTRNAQAGAAAGRDTGAGVARASGDATTYAATPQQEEGSGLGDFLGTLGRVARDVLDGPDRGPQPVVVQVEQPQAAPLPGWVPVGLAVGAGIALALVVRK